MTSTTTCWSAIAAIGTSSEGKVAMPSFQNSSVENTKTGSTPTTTPGSTTNASANKNAKVAQDNVQQSHRNITPKSHTNDANKKCNHSTNNNNAISTSSSNSPINNISVIEVPVASQPIAAAAAAAAFTADNAIVTTATMKPIASTKKNPWKIQNNNPNPNNLDANEIQNLPTPAESKDMKAPAKYPSKNNNLSPAATDVISSSVSKDTVSGSTTGMDSTSNTFNNHNSTSLSTTKRFFINNHKTNKTNNIVNTTKNGNNHNNIMDNNNNGNNGQHDKSPSLTSSKQQQYYKRATYTNTTHYGSKFSSYSSSLVGKKKDLAANKDLNISEKQQDPKGENGSLVTSLNNKTDATVVSTTSNNNSPVSSSSVTVAPKPDKKTESLNYNHGKHRTKIGGNNNNTVKASSATPSNKNNKTNKHRHTNQQNDHNNNNRNTKKQLQTQTSQYQPQQSHEKGNNNKQNTTNTNSSTKNKRKKKKLQDGYNNNNNNNYSTHTCNRLNNNKQQRQQQLTQQQINKLKPKAIKQVEYFFSTTELAKNVFLRKYMDCCGFVPFAFIYNFPSILSYQIPYLDLLKAVHESSQQIEVDLINECVRIKGKDDDSNKEGEPYKKWLFPNPDGTFGCPRWIKETTIEEEVKVVGEGGSNQNKEQVGEKCSLEKQEDYASKGNIGVDDDAHNNSSNSKMPDLAMTDSDTDNTDGDSQ